MFTYEQMVEIMLEEVVIDSTEGSNVSDNQLVNVYEQYVFVNSLIDFDEEMNEWNSRDILPAIAIKNCYIPTPPDSGSSSGIR